MKSMNTVTFQMVKKLAAITNKPYGIWIASLPAGGTSIKLSKLNQVDFKEGDRLSIKGVEAVTTVIKDFSAQSQEEVNKVMDKIQKDWEVATAKNEAVHAA